MVYANAAALISRLVFSFAMLTHGYPKLLRLIAGDHGFADPFGLGESASLFLAVLGEFVCPILIIIGFKTRLASLAPIVTMTVAAFMIHGDDPWKKQELAVIYLAGFLITFLLGSGKFSVDQLLRKV